MGTRQDKFRKSTLDTHKSETIGPKKGPVDFGPEVGYGEGQNSIPSFTQHEEAFNKKYPNLKPLPIMQQIKNRFDPHKNEENGWQGDVAATAAGIFMPAGRAEEFVVALANKMMPALEKAGPKVMAKFADLLKKSKGNPKALESIYAKFNKAPFTSRPVGKLEGKAKIDAWWNNKPAYERKAIDERGVPDLIDTEGNNRGKPDWHVKAYKENGGKTYQDKVKAFGKSTITKGKGGPQNSPFEKETVIESNGKPIERIKRKGNNERSAWYQPGYQSSPMD